jgi:hypothetical protein
VPPPLFFGLRIQLKETFSLGLSQVALAGKLSTSILYILNFFGVSGLEKEQKTYFEVFWDDCYEW